MPYKNDAQRKAVHANKGRRGSVVSNKDVKKGRVLTRHLKLQYCPKCLASGKHLSKCKCGNNLNSNGINRHADSS